MNARGATRPGETAVFVGKDKIASCAIGAGAGGDTGHSSKSGGKQAPEHRRSRILRQSGISQSHNTSGEAAVARPD
eukprot:44565-Pyramimonas_sp.AAC.1